MFAVFAVGLMLCAPLAVTMADEEKESDAVIGFGAGLILGLVIGAAIGYTVGHATSEGSDDYARNAEANALSTGLNFAEPQIATSMLNYSQLWGLTQEHWTRQAELAAAANWSENAEYNPNTILKDSDAYLNSASMLANAGAQTDTLFEDVGKRVNEWSGKEYNDNSKLKLVVSAGSSTISYSSADTVRTVMGTVARNVQSGAQAVYYGGGSIYASEATTLVSVNGYKVNLQQGWNESEPAGTFAYGDIYYLTPGLTFCGPFMTVIDSKAATLDTGIAFIKDKECLLVSCNGDVFSTDGKDSIGTDKGLMVKVVHDGSNSYDCDYSQALVDYSKLFKSIKSVQTETNKAAKTIWNVYTTMGQKCASLTTLSVVNTYSEIQWSDGQREMVSYMMLDELQKYWDSGKDQLKGKSFDMTPDSMSLICRGNVKFYNSESGDYDVASGVAFTPIFYKDTSLKVGANSTSDYCYIIIWGECGSLSSFDTATMDGATMLYAPKGAVMNISEMKLGDEFKSSIDLDCKQIDWIDPYHADDPGPVPDPESNDLAKAIQLILIILGGALMVLGFGRGNIITGIVGIVFVAVGLLFAGDIAGFIEKYLNWKNIWPF